MADEFTQTSPDTSPDSDPVQGIKDAALGQMAKSEDISAYAAERADRDAEASGEDVDTEERAARIREALSKARQDTAEVRQQNGLDAQPPDLDQQLQSAEQEWDEAQQQEATFEQDRELARAEGKFQAFAEDLKQRNPQVWQEITDNLAVLDMMIAPEQGDALRRALLKGDPREGVAIVHRLPQTSVNPDGSIAMTAADKLTHIASLSPQEISEVIDQARLWFQIEDRVSQTYRNAYAAQGRRVSQAPAPFKAPKGGASPPRSLEALAAKGESASDYIKMRQQQMKRARE
jgi:hypothetical protein